MATATTYKPRTREEIAAWLQRARERKQAWEEQTEKELKAMMEEAKRAKESHPQIETIFQIFEDEVQMFNDNK